MTDLAQQIEMALQPYYVGKSGGEHRYNAPWRTGSDSGGLAVNYDRGLWKDWVDESKKGTLQMLAKELGIETSQGRAPVEDTARKYKNLTDYAQTQGAPAATFTEAFVSEVHYQKRPALGFPMRKPDGTGLQMQYRFLDGNKPKWKGQQGFKRCWYGLTIRTEASVFVEPKQPLVICNGATSVIVAHHYGVPAAAIPGGENANLDDYLLEQLSAWCDGQKPPEIIVAMDCDSKGRRIGVAMAENFQKAGYKARAVDLALGNKGDLANFCKLHTETSLETLKALPTLSSADDQPLDNSLLPVEIPQDKIIAHGKTWLLMHAKHRHEIPPIEWILPGEIPDRGLTVVYGPSGVGKSFFTIDRALTIAQKNTVIYMAGEGEGGIPSRIDAWCKHHSKNQGELLLCLGALEFLNQGELETFIDSIKPLNPRVVIVDTMARSMAGADENSTRDMNKFVRECGKLQHILGCAVVLVHHTGKSGDVERGSSVLRAAADSMIALIDDDDMVLVECAKTKDAKPFQTKYMILKPIDVGVVDAHGNKLETPVILPGDPHHREDSELTIKQRKVLEVMALEVFEHGCSPSEISQTVVNVPERTIFKILSRFKSLGYVTQSAKRQPYIITGKGLESIGLQNRDGETAHTEQTAHAEQGADDDSSGEGGNVNGNSIGMLGSNDSNGSNGTLFTEDELRQAVDPSNYGY